MIEALFEILFYYIGKFVASILFPKIHISESTQEPKLSFKKYSGLTYVKGKKKYFYTQAVTFIGLIFCIIVGTIIILISY